MIALLLAAQVAAAAVPPTTLLAPEPFSPKSAQIRVGANCVADRVVVLDRYGRPGARKLGDEPKAQHELAVQRTVNGCVKRVIVRDIDR